jgi:hypothetical protein
MSYNPKHTNSRRRKQERTALEIILVGFFKIIWWLIKLPFGKGGKKGLSTSDRQEVLKKRLELENFLQSDDLFVLKHAVMEADKLVDYALKSSGFAGETFADRLRNAEASINPSNYNKIWQGHKVRNQIAHEHDLRINPFELKEAASNLLEYLKHV